MSVRRPTCEPGYYTVTSAADKEVTPDRRLPVGLIASPGRLEQVLRAVRGCPLLELVGQAGMPQAAAAPEAPWFDDARVLVTRGAMQAVLLASSTRRDAELAALVAERELPVWRLPPVARTFAEATEAVTRMRRASSVQRVASWWEHVVDHAWHELSWPADFKPLLSELHLRAPGPPLESWEASAGEAAGGVLARDAYNLLEALVALRGLPETVTAAVGRFRPGAGRTLRETEDSAVAILRYAGGGFAALHAAWDLPPPEQRLVHAGAAASVTLSPEEVAVRDLDGRAIDTRPLPADPLGVELLRFAELVGSGARDRASAPLERHLAVTALLEATYLAARTGHPESPRKYYQAQGWPEPRP